MDGKVSLRVAKEHRVVAGCLHEERDHLLLADAAVLIWTFEAQRKYQIHRKIIDERFSWD